MSQFVYRMLAGLLAVLFTWYLCIASRPALGPKQAASYCALTALFAVYAIFGHSHRRP